jgi:hypothetical protein
MDYGGTRPRGPSFARVFGVASVAAAVAIILAVLSAPSADAATGAPGSAAGKQCVDPPFCAKGMTALPGEIIVERTKVR